MGGLEGVRNKKLLYHLTKLDNLESIIRYGLQSRRYVIANQMKVIDVADSEIITKRQQWNLDRYIPFHFHPYTAFDYAVKGTYGNKGFVYICIKRAFAEYNNFKILPKHPLSLQECVLYDYQQGLEVIDWDAMETLGTEDEYCKNVKMAECLAEFGIPAELFQCVYVPTEAVKKHVEMLLRNYGITEQPPYVAIQEKWF
ncbi:DarT ssDNA thymidine ADP-ribosyltransferase family protein [Eubacterium sp. MSJ-33]|uniref:DarT ssDNA thymidine ADP-ribosyltransferase family protein n=1 Tax=Eubacterium sp. MSJ-33 TaxID=2841528 RepID=UPI001C760223|nr:DarT ssDNA thymidine ADP-ribosyltransferase family protein [Eubacterium sp. MSJ-33]QWT52111.1 DUF4433 domain-containing protein [Eubacterium sp. MSJ-33]